MSFGVELDGGKLWRSRGALRVSFGVCFGVELNGGKLVFCAPAGPLLMGFQRQRWAFDAAVRPQFWGQLWCGIRWWKAVAKQIAGSLGNESFCWN